MTGALWFDPAEMLIGGRWLRAEDTLALENPSDATTIGGHRPSAVRSNARCCPPRRNDSIPMRS